MKKANETLGEGNFPYLPDAELASMIDHTILKPDCTEEEIRMICAEAREYGFASVCVPPYFVQSAAKFLKDSKVSVSTVIGFPMGYGPTSGKIEEIKRAFICGADEVDAVINIAAVKSGDWNHVHNDIDTMARMTHMRSKTIKFILETDFLTREEALKLCEICTECEADFVKTSTGYNGKGNQPDVIRFLKEHLSGKAKIKASGGIRTREQAEELIRAGADRLGCSASIAIIKG